LPAVIGWDLAPSDAKMDKEVAGILARVHAESAIAAEENISDDDCPCCKAKTVDKPKPTEPTIEDDEEMCETTQLYEEPAETGVTTTPSKPEKSARKSCRRPIAFKKKAVKKAPKATDKDASTLAAPATERCISPAPVKTATDDVTETSEVDTGSSDDEN
jgi:hypothetical protein